MIRVRLKTPEWREIIVQEMKLHWLNNRTLSDAVTNSLLGEDFNSSQVDITLEEEGESLVHRFCSMYSNYNLIFNCDMTYNHVLPLSMITFCQHTCVQNFYFI